MNIKQISWHESNAKKCLGDMMQELWLQGLPTPCASELKRELEKCIIKYFDEYKARFK